MPFDILCFLGDREEMAHSLEARLPFLDHKLYDLAKTIPVNFKMRVGLEKAVLRDAAKGILPEDLRLRRKSGFMLHERSGRFLRRRSAPPQRASSAISRRQSFERAGLSLTAPTDWRECWRESPRRRRLRLKQLRRNANKVIMYMMQTHMLHHMFVEAPPWAEKPNSLEISEDTISDLKMVAA